MEIDVKLREDLKGFEQLENGQFFQRHDGLKHLVYIKQQCEVICIDTQQPEFKHFEERHFNKAGIFRVLHGTITLRF